MMTAGRWMRGGALALVLALGLGGAQDATAQNRRVPDSREQATLSFAPVARQAAPAVVNIFTRRVVQQQANLNPLLSDPFFRQFFGGQIPGLSKERVENSLGSGVIVKPDGVIVTNHHVVKDADDIRVVLSDRREFDARVIRRDERTDLVVLKIDVRGERLPTLELRDSDSIDVGDLVLAIGNPFGVGQTVTQGIVSALARTNAGVTDYRFFIQTDAAINPGNSGGALVTLDGKLVGVNTAIFSRSGGSIGIGFAIPANMVRTVIDGAADSAGRIVRPWLGAGGQTVTADIATSLGLPRPIGVLIKEVLANGPADRAGLKIGDVVTHVDGKEVDDEEALRFRIATGRIGDTMQLTGLRRGRELQISVPLTPPTEDTPRDVVVIRGQNPLGGAQVANLSPALAEEIGFDGLPRGVVILDVARGSPAQRVGLQPGDQVLQINGSEVVATKQLAALVNQPGPWTLAIRRGGKVHTLQIGR